MNRVNATKSCDRRIDGVVDRGFGADIHPQTKCAAAVRFDFGGHGSACVMLPRPDDHVGSLGVRRAGTSPLPIPPAPPNSNTVLPPSASCFPSS